MSADRQSHLLAQDVDSPVPIMFWDPVEFIIAISLLGFGILMNAWILGIVGATLVLMLSKKLKRGAKRGAVQHWVWRMGLQVDVSLAKRFPPACHNEMIE
jgi:type IV conjugative transfer system protein TraL